MKHKLVIMAWLVIVALSMLACQWGPLVGTLNK